MSFVIPFRENPFDVAGLAPLPEDPAIFEQSLPIVGSWSYEREHLWDEEDLARVMFVLLRVAQEDYDGNEYWPHLSRLVHGVAHEVRVLSAHRTPDVLLEYAATAESRGLEVIIAGAGGAAHLAGVTAAKTVLPVLGVPMAAPALNGLDALLAIVQMPGGIPVGTLAIGKAGAVNAALLAAAILGGKHAQYRDAVRRFREKQAQAVLAEPDPRVPKA